MGGRRARSLSDVFGRVDPALERRLKSAVESGDGEALADSASAVARRAVITPHLAAYLEHFTPFIRARLARGTPLEDPRKEVRAEWSRLKRVRSLPVTGLQQADAIVQAVIDFLRARLQ